MIFTIIKLIVNILDIGDIKLVNTKLTDQLIANSLNYANRRLNKAIAISVAKLKLNLEQAFILHELGLTNECVPINQTTLSDILRLQNDNVSRNLTRLENKGLVIRQKKDGFKREKIVQLTSNGELVAKKVNEVISAQRALAFAHIEKEDRARLIENLQAIMK